MIGNVVVFCVLEVFQFPEIFFDFQAQLLGIYDLLCSPADVCRHEYKIFICLFIMHNTGTDGDILFRLIALP